MNKTAFMFPGQGSQYVGMIKSIINLDIVKNTIAYSSKILEINLENIIIYGPEEKLNNTEIAQPLILTISVAIWKLWNKRNGHIPSVLAGHSLGEYSALVCNNTISFEDAIKITKKRAELMNLTTKYPASSMMSILGTNVEIIKKIIRKFKKKSTIVEIAALNTKRHTVISGNYESIRDISRILEINGTKNIMLKINVASHCKLMLDISEEFKNYIKNISWEIGTIPIINSLNINYNKKKNDIINSLVKQLYKPIAWLETVKYLEYIGIKKLIECGPNKILTNLTKRMSKINCTSLENYQSLITCLNEQK
ncbi:MAG TPA: ACP S-malonyltransferase [Candidatus Azoamicus sp. OHIO1]